MDAPRPRKAEFLTLPAEIRCRIYTFLFDTLVLAPRTTDFAAAGTPPESPCPPAADEDGSPPVSSKPASADPKETFPLPLPLFLVSRLVYSESQPVFGRHATVSLATPAQHARLTQRARLPFLAGLRRLSLAYTLLPEWPPTLLRLALPALASFTVHSIPIGLPHRDLERLERQWHRSDAGGSNYAAIDTDPGLVLFRSLVAMMPEHGADALMAHFAECHGRYELRLHFAVACLHVGQIVVPGQFPMAGAPHAHGAREFTYSFNAGG